MRLRSGSTAAGHNPLYPSLLFIANGRGFLPYLYVGENGNNILEGRAGYIVGLSQSFPSFCIDAPSERPEASSWSVAWFPHS